MFTFSEDSNIGFISIENLATALNGSQKQIQLPSFQRDAVWDENHVEKLWNSLVRGFPIGTLIFANIRKQDKEKIWLRQFQESKASPASTASVDEDDETEYIIIDGQQRSIAIALGFRQWQIKDSARLWIDLGPDEPNEETSLQFHVCSLFKPWGRDASIAAQREAMSHLDQNAKSSRDMLSLDDHTLGYTWPVNAKVPVPVGELLSWLQNGRNGAWQNLVPVQKRNNESHFDVEDIFNKLLTVSRYKVPVFMVENLTAEELGEVFQRLNKQGYAMSDEELFFSALKMAWPRAHNLVWEVYRDPHTGRFLEPTKIVHLAVRIVAANQKSSSNQSGDILRLNQKEFDKRIQNEKSDYFLEGLKNLLRRNHVNGDDHEVGHLHGCLRRARQILLYNPKVDPNDPGIPVVLLAKLHWRVWHTLVAWLYNNPIIEEKDRLEMIRYALLDYFFTKTSSNSLIRLPFRKAFGAKDGFPGLEICDELYSRNLLETFILTPEEYKGKLGDEADALPVWGLLEQEWDLSLWIQRKNLQDWFENFDPTLYKKQVDLPYDADHILPKSYKNMRGRTHKQASLFWNWRNRTINSPGNYRFWPKSLNRSDQHKNLSDKYLLGSASAHVPEDSYLRSFDLNTIGDVRTASFISEEDVNDWRIAANELHPYDWADPKRMEAFRRAVDARRLGMYTEFYNTLSLGEWVAEIYIKLRERISKFVIEQFVNPIRESGNNHLIIRAGNLQEAMGLQNQLHTICALLDEKRFHDEADISLQERIGPEISSDTQWEFRVSSDTNGSSSQ